MSQENVGIVQRAIAAFNGTGDIRKDLFDPELVISESPELPGELAGKGYGSLIRAKRTLLDSFEEISVEPERFFDLGERILVFATFRAKGRGSGAPTAAQQAHLLTVRNGKVVEWRAFGDRRRALEAAGLRE